MPKISDASIIASTLTRAWVDRTMTTTETTLIQYWDQPDPPEAIVERMQQWCQQHPSWR